MSETRFYKVTGIQHNIESYEAYIKACSEEEANDLFDFDEAVLVNTKTTSAETHAELAPSNF